MTKNKLKYLYIFTLLLIAVWLILPQGISQALDINFKNPLGTTSTITELAYNILAFILKLAVPIAAIMIVWAGFLFVTSAGNETKIKTAQKTLIWAIIGLAVVMIAQSVPGIIKEFLNESKSNTSTSSTISNSNNTSPSFTIPNSNVVVTPPTPHLGRALGGMKYNGTICVYDPNAYGDEPQCGQPFI